MRLEGVDARVGVPVVYQDSEIVLRHYFFVPSNRNNSTRSLSHSLYNTYILAKGKRDVCTYVPRNQISLGDCIGEPFAVVALEEVSVGGNMQGLHDILVAQPSDLRIGTAAIISITADQAIHRR